MEINNPTKIYECANHLIFSCQYHVVFTPKYRRKVLVNQTASKLKELILAKQTDFHFNLIEMEIMPDHVHLLISVNPKYGVYSVISKLKGFTSFTLRSQDPKLKSRLPTLWTRSSFISSVGSVSLDVVKKYIENQKHV